MSGPELTPDMAARLLDALQAHPQMAAVVDVAEARLRHHGDTEVADQLVATWATYITAGESDGPSVRPETPAADRLTPERLAYLHDLARCSGGLTLGAALGEALAELAALHGDASWLEGTRDTARDERDRLRTEVAGWAQQLADAQQEHERQRQSWAREAGWLRAQVAALELAVTTSMHAQLRAMADEVRAYADLLAGSGGTVPTADVAWQLCRFLDGEPETVGQVHALRQRAPAVGCVLPGTEYAELPDCAACDGMGKDADAVEAWEGTEPSPEEIAEVLGLAGTWDAPGAPSDG